MPKFRLRSYIDFLLQTWVQSQLCNCISDNLMDLADPTTHSLLNNNHSRTFVKYVRDIWESHKHHVVRKGLGNSFFKVIGNKNKEQITVHLEVIEHLLN